jgi:hypothetical protein
MVQGTTQNSATAVDDLIWNLPVRKLHVKVKENVVKKFTIVQTRQTSPCHLNSVATAVQWVQDEVLAEPRKVNKNLQKTNLRKRNE